MSAKIESDTHSSSRPRISYHEFENRQLSFTLNSLSSDGSIHKQEEEITVDSIRSGGFFGKVLIPRDKEYVVKTSLPDPWHHLWRTANLNLKEFPQQYEEGMAQLDHLATRLIHTVLPYVTHGEFYSPDSLGYAWLSTGYAQVVEKMHGRPPRYDTERSEYQDFREAQKRLTRTAFSLGLEQVGQIHDENSFGMANLWRDEKNNRWIWLDTIPAIPHRVFVYPFYYFGFHKDIKKYLSGGKMTFNKIHTDWFLRYIEMHREEFPDDIFFKLTNDLALYEKTYKQYEVEAKHRYTIDAAARALATVMQDSGTSLLHLPIKIIKKAAIEPARIVFDKNYRVEPIIQRIKKAHSSGLLNDEELERAINAIQMYQSENGQFSRDDKVLTRLLATYVAASLIVNAAQAFVAGNLAFGEHNLLFAAESFALLQAFPFLFRPFATYVMGKITHTDLRAAMAVSWIPTLGIFYSIPAQISAWTGSQSKEIWHQTVRNFITGVSSLPIFPYGGLGSQFEGYLMEHFGKKLENLVQFED